MFVFTLRSQERRYVALHSSHIDSMNFMMLYQNHSEYQRTILHFLSQTVRDLPKLNQVAGCRCVVMNGDRLTLRILGWKWELHCGGWHNRTVSTLTTFNKRWSIEDMSQKRARNVFNLIDQIPVSIQVRVRHWHVSASRKCLAKF